MTEINFTIRQLSLSVLLVLIHTAGSKTIGGTFSSHNAVKEWGQYLTTFCFHGMLNLLRKWIGGNPATV